MNIEPNMYCVVRIPAEHRGCQVWCYNCMQLCIMTDQYDGLLGTTVDACDSTDAAVTEFFAAWHFDFDDLPRKSCCGDYHGVLEMWLHPLPPAYEAPSVETQASNPQEASA